MSAHLERLAASPRPVGSESNHSARRYCAEHLRSLGFDVTERPFEFSRLPGQYGAQVIGVAAMLGFGTSLLVPEFLGLTVIGLVVLALALSRKNATRGRLLPGRGINLEAARGTPRVWLVAHIDSKSQPISSAVRTLAVAMLTVPPFTIVLHLPLSTEVTAMAGMVAGALLAAAAVGSASDGAADNASGVAAVLEAAAQVSRTTQVGVLITDAEELALAGATAWSSGRPPGIAVNCDTIDDTGRLTLFEYGFFSRELDAAAQPAVRSVDPRARVMRPLPGVLTDSNAFHRHGWQTVTLSRGTIRTLNRIHTKRDSLDNLRGTGIPDAARVLARLAEELA